MGVLDKTIIGSTKCLFTSGLNHRTIMELFQFLLCAASANSMLVWFFFFFNLIKVRVTDWMFQ